MNVRNKTGPDIASVELRKRYSTEDLRKSTNERRNKSCSRAMRSESRAMASNHGLQSPLSLNRRASTTEVTLKETRERNSRFRLSEAEKNTRDALAQLEKEKQEKNKLNNRVQELLLLSRSLEQKVGELSSEVENVNMALNDTKLELKDTQAHILSLQPYIKDVTPEEVGRDFDDLYSGVCDWVEKWLTPVFDDEDNSAEVLHSVQKNTLKAAGLRTLIKDHPDLVRASMFPDTNQDVIVGVIMRFLYHEIFMKVLYDTFDDVVKVLQTLEESMGTHVQPQRDLFAIRNWRAEAFNSLMNHPEFRPAREQRRIHLTVALGKPLLLFRPQNPNDLYRSLDSEIIKPAFQLQERLQRSIHHFYFEMNIYHHQDSNPPRAAMLLNDWEKVDCEDLFNNRKRLDLNKLSTPPSKEEILERLYPICTTCPRLMMRQVGRGNVIREPTVVRKQKVLAVWGDSEVRRNRLCEESQSLINSIIHAKSGWGTRGNDMGFLTGWL